MPISQNFEKKFLSSFPFRPLLGRADNNPIDYLKRIHADRDRALIRYKPEYTLPFGYSFLYMTLKAVGIDFKQLKAHGKSLETPPTQLVSPKEEEQAPEEEEDALYYLAQQTLDYIHSHQDSAQELHQLESKLHLFVQTKSKC
ncbi:hypothetical protein BY458DRAFT_508235 [Sporodiniella umbellata]|nr:hypothetical protein BY458DRAFT_508235 [Sporodiniella umbellata]